MPLHAQNQEHNNQGKNTVDEITIIRFGPVIADNTRGNECCKYSSNIQAAH